MVSKSINARLGSIKQFRDALTHLAGEAASHDLSRYKNDHIERRLALAAERLSAASWGDLARMLSESEDAKSLLREMLPVKASWFYRDPASYREVEGVIRDIQDGFPGSALRFLSAGSATGEEAYSLAMVLAKRIPAGGQEWEVAGVDISNECIELAREGVYMEESLKELPEGYKVEFLLGERSNTFRISEELRAKVSFLRRDLLTEPQERLEVKRFHLIACRYLLVYLKEEYAEMLVRNLVEVLEPGGFLWLGVGERVVHPSTLGLELARESIYVLPASRSRASVIQSPLIKGSG